MRKSIFLLLLVSIPYWIGSCGICSCKKVSCPAYKDVYLDKWTENFSKQEVLFQNSTSTLDTFTIQQLETSAEYEAKQGCGYGGDNGCDARLSLTSLEYIPNGQAKFQLYYNSTTSWDNETAKQIQLRLKDFNALASDIKDTGFVFRTVGISTRFIGSLSLNGKSFVNVQLIEADTNTKTPGVYKLYFARSKGLIGYEEFPSHELWVRQ